MRNRKREEKHWNLQTSIEVALEQATRLMQDCGHDADSDPEYIAEEVMRIVVEQLRAAKKSADTAEFIERKLGL